MKRKTVALLLAGAMTAAAGGSAQAMTYGYSMEGKNGTITYYEYGNAIAAEMEEETEAAKEPQTDAEKKEMEQRHKIEMQESLAYLKEFGVTYDGEKDVIWYQGKQVRWLIDEQFGEGYKAFQMPEGEIDVYTVRDENFQLTGVREATQEEFDERTRKDAQAEALSQNGVRLTFVEEMNAVAVPGGGDDSIIYSISVDTEAAQDESASSEAVENESASSEAVRDELASGGTAQDETASSGTVRDELTFNVAEGTQRDVPEIDFSIEAADTFGDTIEEGEYLAETKKRREEYRNVGIDYEDTNGCWTWNGRPIFWLVDEDGSMYQNADGREDKIYILVKRNGDGSVKEAKQITVEDVMAERILRMEEETELN
ncbi:MAG: hypothetical protein Q4C61_11960 [Lachnospiraceae bacterium]|nr:hypothetical protein [Lachnospiraceae bacterium]